MEFLDLDEAESVSSLLAVHNVMEVATVSDNVAGDDFTPFDEEEVNASTSNLESQAK